MGRPRLNLDPKLVIDTVRRLGNITHAAAALGCSPAYVANSLSDSGTSLKALQRDASSIRAEREVNDNG